MVHALSTARLVAIQPLTSGSLLPPETKSPDVSSYQENNALVAEHFLGHLREGGKKPYDPVRVRQRIRREIGIEQRIKQEVRQGLSHIRNAEEWKIFAELAGEAWGVRRLQFVMRDDWVDVGLEVPRHKSRLGRFGHCEIGPNGEFVMDGEVAIHSLRVFFGPRVVVTDLNNPLDPNIVSLRDILACLEPLSSIVRP